MLLPRLVRASGCGLAMINDINGNPVIRAVYSFPNTASGGTGLSLASPTTAHGPRIEEAKLCLLALTLTEDETVFASLWEGLGESLVIQDGSKRTFGSIRPQTQEAGLALEILTATGSQMHVDAFGAEGLRITDCEGILVALVLTDAISEQPDRRAVRIGPKTDAGLVVLALLATDLLKGAGTEELNR